MAIELAVAYVQILPEVSKVAPGVKKALGDTDREFESAGKKSGGFFSNALASAVGFVGGRAMLAAGAALGGVVTKGFDRAVKLQSAEAQLNALKVPAERIGSLMNQANESVLGTAFGMDQAVGTAAAFFGANIRGHDEMGRALRNTANAAAVAGTDMDTMGAIFAKAAGSNKVMGDTLAQLGENGLHVVPMLADALGVTTEEVYKLASEGKISFDQFQTALEKGMDPEAARIMGNTLDGALKNTQAALSRVGGAIFTALTPLITGALKGIQGGLKQVGAVITPAVEGLAAGLGSAFALATPALQRMGETLQPLGGAFMDIAAVVAPLVIDLGKLAIGALVVGWAALQGVLSVLVPVIAAVAGWMRENETLVRTLAVAILGGVAAYRTYMVVTGAVRGVMLGFAAASYGAAASTYAVTTAQKVGLVVGKAWAVVTNLAAVAQRVLNAAMRANPIGLIVTALGALVAGLIYAYKNSETFRNVVNAVWNGIRSVVGVVIDWFVNTVAPFFVGLWETLTGGAKDGASGFTGVWQGVKDFFAGLWDGIKAVFGAALDFLVGLFLNFTPLGLVIQHWEPISGFFSGLWGGVKALFSGALDFILGLFLKFHPLGIIISNWEPIKAFFAAVWNEIKATFSGALGFITDLFLNWTTIGLIIKNWDGIVAFFVGLWERVSGAFMAGLDAIWAVVGPWVTWFMGVFKAAWGVLELLIALPIRLAQIAVAAAWKLIQDAFSAAWGWVSGVFIAQWNSLTGLVGGVMTAVQAAIGAAWTWITDRFAQAWAWVSGVFIAQWRLLTGLIDTVLTAVRNAVGVAWQWIQDRFAQAWAWVSGVFMGQWRQLTGLIDAVLTAVRNAVNVAWQWIQDRFQQAWAWVSGVFMGQYRTLTSLIDTVMTAVRNAIGAAWQWITDRFTQAWQWVSGTFMGWWNTLTGLMETPIRLAREAIDRILTGIRNGFEQAVNFVRDTWDRIKEIVSAPVRIAIRVGNALISGFRTVARAVGLDDIAGRLVDIPPLPAMKTGGVIPGQFSPAHRDNVLAVTSRGVPTARVEPGEYVSDRKTTSRWLPLLQSLPKYAKGGLVGSLFGHLPGFFMGGTMPTTGGAANRHTSGYSGYRYAGDLPRPMGTPVYAWHDGIVAYIKRLTTSYGNHIMLNHAAGLGQSLYAHLSRIDVSTGQAVKAGQQIGAVGSTGNSTGPHLHFEIRGGNSPISGDGAADTGGGGSVFDWLGDLAGKFAGPLKELASINDSPVGQFVKAIPKMIADGMIQKVKDAVATMVTFGDSSMSGAQAGAGWQGNANLLMQAGKSLAASRHAMHIALMTAAQESSMGTNRTAMTRANGDGDVGWFQQRTTRGDGTIAQLADPLYALRVFLHGVRVPAGYHVPGLYNIRGWEGMSKGAAAQRVQVSAYPAAYDKWEDDALGWLNNFKYDQGGILRPGLTLANNQTSRPEAILTQPQWANIERMVATMEDQQDTPGRAVHVTINNPLNERASDQIYEAAGLISELAFR